VPLPCRRSPEIEIVVIVEPAGHDREEQTVATPAVPSTGSRTFFKWLALPTLGHQAIDQLGSQVFRAVMVEDRVESLR